MLELTEWMAEHYLCTHGQVLTSVIPAGVTSQAGTRERTFLSVTHKVKAMLAAGEIKLPPKQADALKVLAESPRPLTVRVRTRHSRRTSALAAHRPRAACRLARRSAGRDLTSAYEAGRREVELGPPAELLAHQTFDQAETVPS